MFPVFCLKELGIIMINLCFLLFSLDQSLAVARFIGLSARIVLFFFNIFIDFVSEESSRGLRPDQIPLRLNMIIILVIHMFLLASDKIILEDLL